MLTDLPAFAGNPSSLITDIDSSASGSGGSLQYSGEFVPPLCPPTSGSGDSGSGLPSSSGSGGPPSSSETGGSSLPNSSQSGDSALPSTSGSGGLLNPSESGENDGGFSPVSGSSGDMSSSASGDGSASGCVSGSGVVFTKAALLEADLQKDGGIECSDAGQYECVAGLYTELDIISLDINITVTGERTFV